MTEMPPNTKLGDLVLLVPTSDPIQIDGKTLQLAGSVLSSRLSCDTIYVDFDSLANGQLASTDAFQSQETLRQHKDRIVIIPCGFEALNLGEIRSAWWFQHLPECNGIYVAEPWTEKEVGQWIGNSIEAFRKDGNTKISFSIQWPSPNNQSLDQRQIETLVLIAFWANQTNPGAVVLGKEDVDHPISSNLDSDLIATWMLQRYLRSVRSRPIPWNPEADVDWPTLNRLHSELQRNLPSEYAQRLDDVSPQSMGSAKIAPDDTGKIPWDTIWTSFCDLAMAGGPPHRGRLLEPVCLEDIERSKDSYGIVVAEIRRGIELASGLGTCESPYLGWVGVECDSEQMAAWLLRAILVENISVRRESNRLYLPAGPDYRIDKEIKNVITAVAKTTHYWRAHLRSRQPPNPL